MKKLRCVFLQITMLSILTSCGSLTDKKGDVQHSKTEETLADRSSKAQNEVNTMIANDEKIIEMLKEKGEIPENASQEEITKALQKYLKNKVPGNLQDEKAKKNDINRLKEKIKNESKSVD
jgi:bacillopeptidase F (M6 metalloprotease family)